VEQVPLIKVLLVVVERQTQAALVALVQAAVAVQEPLVLTTMLHFSKAAQAARV
jgi:hypothetical protein